MTSILTTVALNILSNFLFHILLTLKKTMSRRNNQNQETADTPETVVEETPQAETPATEPSPAPSTDTPETAFVCPACKHTTGVKLGTPGQNGAGQDCQLVMCEKCNHVIVDVLS